MSVWRFAVHLDSTCILSLERKLSVIGTVSKYDQRLQTASAEQKSSEKNTGRNIYSN